MSFRFKSKKNKEGAKKFYLYKKQIFEKILPVGRSWARPVRQASLFSGGRSGRSGNYKNIMITNK
jgi:hypothetical protein